VPIDQAAILVGGKGTRLGDLSRNCPKPMQDVGGKPFLEYIIWNLKRYGISKIILLVGHQASVIVDHFGDGAGFGIKIAYAFEDQPLGTGGALRAAAHLLDDTFLFMNGDTIFDFNYDDLAVLTQASSALLGLGLRKVDDAARFGNVRLEGNKVASFAEKAGVGAGLINGGVAVVKKEALALFPEGVCSLEQDILPSMVSSGYVCGKQYEGFFIDIGLPETLADAAQSVPRWKKKDVLFLDRDGVLNRNLGYVATPDRFQWIDGAVAAVKSMNDVGVLVIIVTNQAGIARGYYSEAEFEDFMLWINAELRMSGAHLDGWYFCPHHPEQGVPPYRCVCDCRKPEPGMLIKAMHDWEVDPSRALLLGDSATDISAAERSGIEAILYSETNGPLVESIPATFYS
jgi:D,D-heptose 1,7-bisphosphate phosphatase